MLSDMTKEQRAEQVRNNKGVSATNPATMTAWSNLSKGSETGEEKSGGRSAIR